MEDVTVDDIIETTHEITNGVIESLEVFLYSLKEFEKEYRNCNDILNPQDLISSSDIEQWQKDRVKEINKNVSENVKYFETIYEETEQLKLLEKNVVKEIAKNEETLKHLRKKISNTNKKKDKLMAMRDEVQVCKLLTNTTFAYKGSNISGYVAEPHSKQIVCFDFNSETSAKEIPNSLYNILREVSCNVDEI